MAGAYRLAVLFVVCLAAATCAKRQDDFPQPVLIPPPPGATATAQPVASDDEIRAILIEQSRAAFSGRCACPDDRRLLGRRCGEHSAYSKGVPVLCYPSDVSADMILNYRLQHYGATIARPAMSRKP